MLDPRLFELLRTLAAANLDWLVDEVVQGVLAGDIRLEREDAVKAARDEVDRASQDRRSPNVVESQIAEAASFDAAPLEGDAQLEWAIAHVTTRLRDALSMMRIAAERLDTIIRNGDSEGIRSPAGRRVSTQLELIDGEEVLGEAGSSEFAAAEQALADLKQALEQWRGSSYAILDA